MEEILGNIQYNDAMVLTAPPGWGKTYKILSAIKQIQETVVFIFPLRALCDEIYISALERKIDVLNIRKKQDAKLLDIKKYQLILCTPEVFTLYESDQTIIYILDEFHLFYYWGESFREKMYEIYMEITCNSSPLILLTATLSSVLKEKLFLELQNNYQNIYHINYGNQQLKNWPNRFYFYPKELRRFLEEDIMYSALHGTSLVFCQYRSQVGKWVERLEELGFRVISCVGGQAAAFIEKLSSFEGNYDFIVATSVVSHGVNLPNIKRLYFLYKVDNLDFYLQMLGRGGREGRGFEVHIQNTNYFPLRTLVKGLLNVFVKRFSNRINYLLYSLYES